MFSSTLALADKGGANVSFAAVKNLPDGVRRVNTASTLSEPNVLNIQHTSSGRNGDLVDRHLVQVSKTILVNGAPYTLIVNQTIAMPRVTGFDADDVADALNQIYDLLSDGIAPNITTTTAISQLLRGES